MKNPPAHVYSYIRKASGHRSHLSISFRPRTNPLDLPTPYSLLPRTIGTFRGKMANIHSPIPQLKLNDGTSIPMARKAIQNYKHKLILDIARLWQYAS